MLKHAKLLLGVSFGLNLMLLYSVMFRPSGTKVVAEFDIRSKNNVKSNAVPGHNQRESQKEVILTASAGSMVRDSIHKIKNNINKQYTQHVIRKSQNKQTNRTSGNYAIQDQVNIDGGLYNDNEDNAQPLIPSRSRRIIQGGEGHLIHQLVKSTQQINEQRIPEVQQRRMHTGQQRHGIQGLLKQGQQIPGDHPQQPHEEEQQNHEEQPRQTGEQEQQRHQSMSNTQQINSGTKTRQGGQNEEQLHQTIEQIVQTSEDAMSFVATDESMRVYNWNGQTWMGNKTVCNNLPMFRKATLFSHFGHTPIFVHNPEQDKWISDSLIRSGSWEPEVSKAVTNALGTDPDLMLLDIGANIGVVSLVSALMGRPVISIEPLRANVQRLCASYRAGQLTDHVAIVLNALSDKHENVSLGRDLNNVGGTFVINENPNKAQSSDVSFNGSYLETVPTILLDDLLTLFPKNVLDKVVMKIDVEGYEDHVLRGAERFFKEVHVRAVVMEWTYSKQQSTAEFIKQFLLRQNLLPFDLTMSTNLYNMPSANWPSNIVWLNKLHLSSR